MVSVRLDEAKAQKSIRKFRKPIARSLFETLKGLLELANKVLPLAKINSSYSGSEDGYCCLDEKVDKKRNVVACESLPLQLEKQGYPDSDEENILKENKKKDSKVLVIIQQAIHDRVFSRIAMAITSKQAWSILWMEFQGDLKVIVVRLQLIRRDFETLYMKSGESISDFSYRTMAIVSQVRSYGEKISNETVVAKVLRSLTPKFDHVVPAIEEYKDLSIFSFDKLMGSLQAHKSRINRSLEKKEEKTFQVKETVTKTGEAQSATIRGRGGGGFHGRGNGRGRRRLD
ncbi:hypothetical protein RJ639_006232 [Escallonia herrerae]|uniref:UBN2 domain-containing protein n=1 Tax=Escallonia herrerae TaxID=1293975 RepID=A0AA88VWF5_9ASTE|nr:hypothetical protein RJ639_006232 [Escallonia herrerae]